MAIYDGQIVSLTGGGGGGAPTPVGVKVWVPSDATGATDMAAELEAVVAANINKTIVVDSGSVVLLRNFGDGLNFTTLKASGMNRLSIDFSQATCLQDNDANLILLDGTPLANSDVLVSSVANVTRNGDGLMGELVLSSVADTKVHDWICVYSDDANPSRAGGRMGEMHQIAEISGNTVYTPSIITRPSNYTTNVLARVIDDTIKVDLKMGRIESNGDADDPLITTREETIFILGFVYAEVTGPEYIAPWGICCRIQVCASTVHSDFRVVNILNQGDSDGFSYGTQFYGMNSHCIATNGLVLNGRHPGATTDGNGGNTNTWFNKGYPTDCKIQYITGDNCYGSVADTHEEGFRTTISNIIAHGAKQDSVTSFVGRAVQSRAAEDTIFNIQAIDCASGIVVTEVDHGETDKVTIDNCVFRRISDSTGGNATAIAIQIRDQDLITNKRDVSINNCTFEGCDKPIVVGETATVSISGIKTSGSEADIDARDACIADVEGHKHDSRRADFYNRGTTNVVLSRGTSSVDYLEDPVVIMGGNSQPSNFFEERDTSGSKSVSMPNGIRLYNRVGATPVNLKEPGSTTFVNSSYVSEVPFV